MDRKVAIFHLGLVGVQRRRWWAGDHVALGVEMPIVTWTDVFFEIGFPVHVTAQMGAYVRKDGDRTAFPAHYVDPEAVHRLLPTVHYRAGEAERGGHAYRVILQRAQGDSGVRPARLERRGDQVTDGGQTDHCSHDGPQHRRHQGHELAAVHTCRFCHEMLLWSPARLTTAAI